MPRGALPMVEDVARHLRPAPRVVAAADSIVSALGTAGPYNGIHLRMKADAQYQDLVGGTEARLCPDRPLRVPVAAVPPRLSCQTLQTQSIMNDGARCTGCLTHTPQELGVCAVQAAWLAYFQSMRSAGFDSSTPLYVASGLLTYMNASGALLVASCT